MLWIEVQDRYYRLPNGDVWHERWMNGKRIQTGIAPVVFVDWMHLQSIWTTMVELPTALMKEGPKAIVLYRK